MNENDLFGRNYPTTFSAMRNVAAVYYTNLCVQNVLYSIVWNFATLYYIT